MLRRGNEVSRRIELIHSLVPPGENVRDYLGQLLDEHLGLASGDTPMGVVSMPMFSAISMVHSPRLLTALARKTPDHQMSPTWIGVRFLAG